MRFPGDAVKTGWLILRINMRDCFGGNQAPALKGPALAQQINLQMGGIQDAFIAFFTPPPESSRPARSSESVMRGLATPAT
jgi:hypothetical protein